MLLYKSTRARIVNWRPIDLVLVLVLTLFPGALRPELSFAQETLRIERAAWQASQSKLVVKGDGPSGEQVIISNADSGVQLGAVIINGRGSWRWAENSPLSVPCRVAAATATQSDETGVLRAPNDCDASPPEPPPEPVDDPPPMLTGIQIMGPQVIEEGENADFAALAAYSDGTLVTVTSQSTWSTYNDIYATIDGNGVLTAGAVDADHAITVTAVFHEQEITASDTIQIQILDTDQPPDDPGEEPLSGSHAGRFSAYEGTQTCLACHRTEAQQVHASVHYQWQGDAAETVGLDAYTAGKLGGINDFCIYPDINWIGKLTNVNGDAVDGGCAKCHVGLGGKPSPDPTPAQLENIDCLVCHSSSYKRTVAVVNGTYRFVADTANMTVSLLQAASDLQLPDNDSCLNCHTKAGGGDNFKRGDIEEAHRNPTADFDVHMAPRGMGGAGLSCLDCHTSTDHKIAGRGTDLRPRENPADISCANCHGDQPHDDQKIDKHTARVNCTVCHIPQFAKVAPTDMDRDWSQPGDLVASTGLYEPHHAKGQNVPPAYRFFNGLSYFYQFGDAAQPGPGGRVVMSAPLGTINDPGAKIHAFKYHRATQPMDPQTQRLLPLKIGKFFESGEIDQAAALGAQAVGWEYNGHEFVETERYMGLFHEVAPKEQALTCASCHGGGNRLDFAALGYTPKSSYNQRPLCASCHEDESDEWNASVFFSKLHEKHVKDKKLDCASCHTFSAAN